MWPRVWSKMSNPIRREEAMAALDGSRGLLDGDEPPDCLGHNNNKNNGDLKIEEITQCANSVAWV